MASIKFFDSHIHIWPGHEGKLTGLMDSGHVDGMNLILRPLQHPQADESNKEGFDLKAKYGKMVQLAHWVDLTDGQLIAKTKKHLDDHPEIDGIKIHPAGDHTEITEENIGPMMDLAMERDLYMITHTNPLPGFDSTAFHDLLAKRRDLRFIMGHSSPIEQSIYLAVCFENVYLEPCWLAHFSLFFEMAGRLLHHKKILVGTDGPGRFDTWQIDGVRVDVIEEEIQHAVKHIPGMKEVQMYCYDNAAEFFRL
ncbi:amidohydrolase family protein [Planctomycetota bacterium]